MTRNSAQIVRIGGLGLRFVGRSRADLPGPFADFAGSGPCVSRLSVREEPGAPDGALRPLCDAGAWALFESRDGLRYEGYAPPLHGKRPVLQADASADWSEGIVRVDPELCPLQTRLAPISSPFGEFLLMSLLNRDGGLYVHAASVVRDGGALLFLGKSGAGKTTLSGLARSQGAEVLSDDRTALRFVRGRLTAFGTPFHGTGRHWAARRAPVHGVFFLEHAPETRARRLPLGEAAARLAALCFAPFWNRIALDELLRQSEAAARAVPAHVLGFTPDLSALEALDAVAPRPRHAHGR